MKKAISLAAFHPKILQYPFFNLSGKSSVPSTSKKVITNKTVLPPVVVKQEFAKQNLLNHNNNNIPSHLDVPKKLPSAKKSPPPPIKSENIKLEGELWNTHMDTCNAQKQLLKAKVSWFSPLPTPEVKWKSLSWFCRLPHSLSTFFSIPRPYPILHSWSHWGHRADKPLVFADKGSAGATTESFCTFLSKVKVPVLSQVAKNRSANELSWALKKKFGSSWLASKNITLFHKEDDHCSENNRWKSDAVSEEGHTRKWLPLF